MSILTSILGLDGIAGAASEFSKGLSSVLMKVTPDADKRMEIQAELEKLQAASAQSQMQAMQAVMVADSGSDNWLTKSARPILVFWCLAMVTLIFGLGAFGIADPAVKALAQVPDALWNAMLYGCGIFVGGRSAEKVASTIATAVTTSKALKK